MIEITFLGTSCAIPTKDRNHAAVLLRYGNEGILLDCGEGTQRQLKIAGINANVITKILVTHWHGDHTIGLPGLLDTLSMGNKEKKIAIYGPKGSKERMEHITKAFSLKGNYEVHEVKAKFFENDDFTLEAAEMNHGIACLGFAFAEKDRIKVDMAKVKKLGIDDGPAIGKLQRGEHIKADGKEIGPEDIGEMKKGKRIVYITDTLPNKNAEEMAKDADLLICESSYASNLAEKAEEYFHMTAQQAAYIATKAGAKRLVLTHFSQRYKTTGEIEEDARNYFKDVSCAFDFMKIKL